MTLMSTDPNLLQNRFLRTSSIMITINQTTEILIQTLKDITIEIFRETQEIDLLLDMLKSLILIDPSNNNPISKEKIDKIFKNHPM